MTEKEKKRMNLELPIELWERLHQSSDTKKGQIVEALEIYYGDKQTGSRAAIERQIQRFEEQRARGKQLVRDGEDMIEEAEEGISRLKSRLDELESSDQKYSDALDEQLEYMRNDGAVIFEGHPSLERIANDHGKTQSEVLDDLRNRSDLDESYFTQGSPDTGIDRSADDFGFGGGSE